MANLNKKNIFIKNNQLNDANFFDLQPQNNRKVSMTDFLIDQVSIKPELQDFSLEIDTYKNYMPYCPENKKKFPENAFKENHYSPSKQQKLILSPILENNLKKHENEKFNKISIRDREKFSELSDGDIPPLTQIKKFSGKGKKKIKKSGTIEKENNIKKVKKNKIVTANEISTIETLNSQFDSEKASISELKEFSKKKRIYNRRPDIKVKRWTKEECQLYEEFIKNYFLAMKDSSSKRNTKVFLQMSEFIGTKVPSQCRSHHQKFYKKLIRSLNGEDVKKKRGKKATKKKIDEEEKNLNLSYNDRIKNFNSKKYTFFYNF